MLSRPWLREDTATNLGELWAEDDHGQGDAKTVLPGWAAWCVGGVGRVFVSPIAALTARALHPSDALASICCFMSVTFFGQGWQIALAVIGFIARAFGSCSGAPGPVICVHGRQAAYSRWLFRRVTRCTPGLG